MVKYFFAIVALLLSASAAYAEPRLHTEVHPTFGAIDDAYIFSVVLDGANDSPDTPSITGGNDFTLSFIGPQTSVEIMNGSVKRQVIFNYQLIPKHAGSLNTPGAEVTADGQHLTAAPQAVNVSGTRSVVPETANKEYFMRQNIDSGEHVYAGQQLTLTLEIFTRVNILSAQLGDFTFPGFQNEPVGEQENTRRLLEDGAYSVSTLRRALFPLNPGVLEIPARELRAKIRARTGHGGMASPFGSLDPFSSNFVDDFFGGGQLKDIVIRSNPLQLHVEPLPPAPANFPHMGLDAPPVGRTSISLAYNPGAIKYGETKTVQVKIASYGSIQSLKSTGLQSSPALRVYEQSPQTDSAVGEHEKLLTTKSIKLSLVPSGGSVNLPPFELGYFDPASGTYNIARSKPIQFDVIGAPPPPTPAPAAQTSAVSSTAASSSAAGALTYNEESALERITQQISPALALLVLASVLGVGIALALGAALRRKFAPRRAVVAAVDQAQTPDAILAAVREAVAKTYPALTPQFSREDLRRTVTNTDLVYRAESILDRCDAALFGGREIDLSKIRDDARALVQAL